MDSAELPVVLTADDRHLIESKLAGLAESPDAIGGMTVFLLCALHGDLVRVTPNHVCPVINLFDKVVVVRGKEVLGAVKVDARGMVQ